MKVYGSRISYYTGKLEAYLRYKNIAYSALPMPYGDAKMLKEKVGAVQMPIVDDDGKWMSDTTPIIMHLETEHPVNSVLPQDPAVGFISHLIEDYGDEWLTKAMFHYRWYFDADIKMAGTILPRWSGIQNAEEKLVAMSDYIAKRQISRLYVVGSNDVTANVIENSYKRFLSIMDDLIQKQTSVLGQRPSSADFGLYAQLTQLAKFDPTPAQICMEQAPRVHAWTDIVDDLSGNTAADSDWMDVADITANLGPLLNEIGRVYAPALLANAEALQKGASEMETTIDGQRWVQPTFAYQGKCLAAINQEYQNLDADSRAEIDDIFAGTGCETILFR